MHTLVVGMSEIGKTTLCKRLAKEHRKQGFKVIVLTAVWEDWDCDFMTDDQDEFLDVFWKSQSCIAFMDEGGSTVGRYNNAMILTATQGRHWGHSCYYIVQNAVLIAPVIRDQCRQLICFNCSDREAERLAENYKEPLIQQMATDLPRGDYIRTHRFQEDDQPKTTMGSAFK